MSQAPSRKRQVLVVDDSAFMRKAISRIIRCDDSLEVIATARDGQEALSLLNDINPDVITLDVEMPGMNGLEALRQIRTRCATPVIMVSSITRFGSDIAIECLQAGAFDIVCKPESYVSMNISDISFDLHDKIKAAVAGKDRRRASLTDTGQESPPVPTAPTEVYLRKASGNRRRLITIGCSTGGPVALNRLLSALPRGLEAGIVVVQHMPPGGFISSLAERLNGVSALEVRVAQDGDAVSNGLCLIAPIGRHVIFESCGRSYVLKMSAYPESMPHCPSVDVLFQSAGAVARENNISCILTGMGSDGVVGLQSVRDNNGWIIAESELSAMIFGMPRCAIEAGLANEILPLDSIPAALTRLTGSVAIVA